MKSITKIRAFTIIELVVTMLIASVVTAIAYNAYYMLNRQFLSYRNRSASNNTYFLLSTAFQNDFDRALAIQDTLDNRHLIFTGPGTQTRYEIGQSFIVRQSNGSIDSFLVHSGEPVVTLLNDSISLIRAITIPVYLNGDTILLSGDKLYSSQQFLSAQTTGP
jgi:prepilin-type N-terminal cleavage/methylation domain-containing protein